MHSALLIDEVLEVILEHCADWPCAEYRWTLCQLARCCKAWRDPALDRLWKRLDSVQPLAKLECCGQTESSDELERFLSYSKRIRHIVCQQAPHIPEQLSISAPFADLKSIALQGDGCLIPPSCLSSSSLQDMDIDLRGARPTNATRSRANALVQTFEALPRLQDTLHRLRIKGFMSPALNGAIPSFYSLRSLVLLTGQSLTAETLASLGSFPHLQDIYVHASDIDAEDFSRAISTQAVQPFPTLRSLRIRAQRSLFRALLDVLPPNTLESLYLETEDPAQGPAAWHATFALIAAKAGRTLAALTLDQILDPEELDATLAAPGADARIALDTLAPLQGLRALRRLTIDAMLLPDFADADVDTLGRWWPALEHLDLGALPDVQDRAAPAPTLTVRALRHLAARCASLRSLTIPLDTSSCSGDDDADADAEGEHDGKEAAPPVRQRALQSLFVGPPPADEHIGAFVRSVLELFPCVKEIECTSAERSLSVEVQTVFKDAAHRKGTSDGCADGQ